MKKIIFSLLLIALTVGPAFSSWTSVVVDPAVNNSSSSADDAYPCIAVDASGDIHVVYFDFTGINDSTPKTSFKYAKIHDSSTTIGTIESVFNTGRKATLKLDSTGALHTAYYDYTNKKVKYAKYNGSSWTTAVVDDAKFPVANRDYVSLGLDSSNQPHIGYYSSQTNGTILTNYLKYAYYDGSWHTSTLITDITGNHTGYERALVMDSADHPYLIYSEDSALKCIKNTGSGWQIQTIENVYPNRIFATRDSSNNIYVSYYDQTNSLGKVAKYNGSSWVITELTGNAAGIAGPIAINPATGYPAIESYYDC